MKTPRTLISGRDYDMIILDMLDDIVLAEQRATHLIDRIDSISNNSALRVVDIELYLWASAAIIVAAFLTGTFAGYFIHFWLKGG